MIESFLLAISRPPGMLRRAVTWMVAWMEGFAATPHAAWALFAFAFAESSFFPIPPDVLLILLCVTDAALGSLAVGLWYAAVCSAGSVIGGAVGYVLGLYAGRPILKRIARPETVESAERLLQRYDVWAVAAAGFTPIPYKVFTISSGMLRVRPVRFVIASVLSRSARFFLVAVFCFVVGRPAKELLEEHFAWATLAFFALLVGGFYVVRLAVRISGRSDGERARPESAAGDAGQLASGSAGARPKAGQLASGSAGARPEPGQLASGSAGARPKAGAVDRPEQEDGEPPGPPASGSAGA